jgi:hypothetical protein
MSGVSIVSNPSCESIFIVHEMDKMVSVLIRENWQPVKQYNFHFDYDGASKATFELRWNTLRCNLDSVKNRMHRAGVPRTDQETVLTVLSRRLERWEKEWCETHLCPF